MARLIDGVGVAARIEEEAARACATLQKLGVMPSLVAVQVGQDPASELFWKRQIRICRRLRVAHRVLPLPENTSEQELLREISRLNRNSEVTGIILQMPLPPHISYRTARRALQPDKDVEGIHPENLGSLLSGLPTLIPCTAAAVLQCLVSTGVSLAGKEAVVVGSSEIVGKPVALLLMERLATVTICHAATRDLLSHVRRAELLVVAAGRPALIPGDAVREGAVVIDVGINKVEKAGTAVIVGDVETEAAAARAAFITPVPGGVGPVTVATLLHNTIKAAASQGPLPM